MEQDYDIDQETWGCDVPISMPEPPKMPLAIPMEGFAFTLDGLVHGVTEVDLEQMKHPTFGPERAGDV